MIGKLALFAALAGSAVGATVVLADDRAPVASDVPVVAATRPGAAPTPTPMPARDIHVLVQTPDPKGAQPWAVRRFTTTLSNRSLVDCFELGRLDGDRFGWVDATGTFEPVGAGSSEWTTICRAPAAQRALGVTAQRFTMLTQPAGGTLEPLESVTFGVAASAAARVVPSDEPALVPGPDGIVLRVVPGQSPPGPFAGVLEYRDGRRTRFNRIDPPRWKGERAIAGTETVAVRAPDPAGGEPWGLIASRGERGSICLSAPGRVIGTQRVRVERSLGIAYPDLGPPGAICPDPARTPTRAFPLRLDVLSSSIGGDDPRGRIERRVLSNRIVYSGRVYKDVASVTIRTPRDVRTLIPAGPAHVILAVYDGAFPTGKVTATAHFKAGKEVTRSLYAG